MTRSLRPVLAAALLVWCAVPALAQKVTVTGDVHHAAADSLRALLARGGYRVLDRDTLLPAEARLPGDLVVVRATVRLAGTVEGSVAVLGGTFFVRPGARIGGTLLSVGGLVLPSDHAEIGDTLSLPLDAAAEVSPAPGGYAVSLHPPAHEPVVVPGGVYGLWLPTYDRANGLSPRLRARVNLGTDSLAPDLVLGAVYHTARRAFGGSATLVVPLGRHVGASLRAARATPTNERWIRGDLVNSAATLLARSDAYDFYASDQVSLTLEGRHGEALIAGEGYVAPRLRVLTERDRSLRAHDVFSFTDRDDPWRPNPAIAEGDLLSVTGGAALRWQGATSSFTGDVAAEVGRLDPLGAPSGDGPGSTGASDFSQIVADGRWTMVALWGHSLTVHGHLVQALGPDGAPPQRWSFVGGPGTLPTLPYAARRGDRLVFLASSYLVPLPALPLPLVGAPALILSDAVGTAWTTGEPVPALEQNVGAGLQLSYFYVTFYFDPTNLDRPALSVGLSLP